MTAGIAFSYLNCSSGGRISASLLPKWGVNVHNYAGLASAADTLSLLQEVGANCVRDVLNWDLIETSSGVYDWTAGNNFATWWNTFCAAGLYPVFCLSYNNVLYSSGIFSIVTTGANTMAFANYAVAAANNFISTCPNMALEIWNEENLTWTTDGVQWTGGAYAIFAQDVAAAIKAAQPSVTVISGGLSPGGASDPVTYAGQMIAGATLSSVDWWGSHPYNFTEGTPTNTLTPESMMTDDGSPNYSVPALATAFGSQQKPMVITEHNYPANALNDGSCSTTATNKLQGIYVAWSMLEAAFLQVKAYVVYDLINDGTPCGNSDQYTYGLFSNPGDSPALAIKYAGIGFKTVTNFFSGAISYSLTDYSSLSVREITIYYADGSVGKAIWQTPAGASLASPILSGITYSENMGNFSNPTAIDSLGNSVSLTVSESTISFALSQPTSAANAGTGPVFVNLPII